MPKNNSRLHIVNQNNSGTVTSGVIASRVAAKQSPNRNVEIASSAQIASSQ